MNIEIANRLVKLRKDHGYSQEQLADKLGVSRQAISKWERGEASPDTDNLICLAKLYNVSLDELLNTNIKQPEVDQVIENNFKTDENPSKDNDQTYMNKGGIHIVNGQKEIHVGPSGICIINDKDEEETSSQHNKKEIKIYGLVSAILTIVITVIYLLLGFYVDRGWEVGWILFLIIPTVDSLLSAIFKKRMNNFAFPVVVTGIYVAIGLLASMWHPTWVLFLLIPVYYVIADFVDKNTKRNEIEKNINDYVDEITEK